jgi:DNA-binding SARP family transcriptional activator
VPKNATAHQVTLLDGFTLHLGDSRPIQVAHELPRGVQRLVAHICLCGQPARDAVASRLWPDVPERQAHGSLRSALWRLEKAAPGLVQVTGSHLALAEGVRVDVHVLSRWARRAVDPRSDVGELSLPDPDLSGDLLPGWYDDWVLLERERLSQLRAHALEVVSARLVRAGRHGEAIQAAYAAVQAEPLRESAHRAVVCVHLAEGNVAEALQVYRRFSVMLKDELGIAPTAQMARLVRGLPKLAH